MEDEMTGEEKGIESTEDYTKFSGEESDEEIQTSAYFGKKMSQVNSTDALQESDSYAGESWGELPSILLNAEPFVNYGGEENIAEENIAEEIVPEEVLTSQKTEIKSLIDDILVEIKETVFHEEPESDDHKFRIEIDLNEDIEIMEEKLKGRSYHKMSDTDSDIESDTTKSLINLPKIIKEPLLLREVFLNLKAVKFDEQTDRMGYADPFELESSVYDSEPEDGAEESVKKQNAILRVSFLKNIVKAWMPRRDTIEVFEKFFYPKSESAGELSKKGAAKPSLKFGSESSSELFDKLSQYFLLSMCRKYKENYWDLVLHGREVENHIGRRIVDDDIVVIFEFCIYNDQIRYVDLCYNRITSIGLALIAYYVAFNHNIIGLNVMNNEIESISKLTRKQLGLVSNLRQLRLNGNPLNKPGRINAACLLKYNQLELLDLAETSQNVRSIAWVAEFAQTCTSIKVLDISRIIGQRGYNLRTYKVALFFSDVLKHNTSLSELHLQKNGLNDNDIETLMWGLVAHPKLKVLDLTCNDVCDFGAEIIAKSLDKVESLISLSLACNKVRNAGTRALSLRLPYSKITVLNLARNHIGDEGMIDLMNSIRKPYPLQALFIFGNPFGVTTLETLSNCLKTCILSPNTVDTHVTIVDGAYSVVHYPLGDRYKSRYYRQYESWKPGVWRWNGAPPMYYGIKKFKPSNNFSSRDKFPLPTKGAAKNSCGI
ncbi:uncharacterized protein isoform X3 [Rhodnius prolixus]|uniref:uncharacterized protein isoform X3 n=1 Tax=Rhodnius prolixus TaxID=13249 RepID=UPI003D18AEFA